MPLVVRKDCTSLNFLFLMCRLSAYLELSSKSKYFTRSWR